MSEREIYIQRFEAARAKMKEMVQLARENRIIYEPWRMKEVLDHITGWDDAIIASINSLLSGDIPATPAMHGANVYNAETVSTREALPYAVSLREWEASRTELLHLLHSITDAQFTQPFTMPWGGEGSIKTIVDMFSDHEEVHVQEISQIIQQGR